MGTSDPLFRDRGCEMKRTTIAIAIASICFPASSFAADPRCAMGLFVLCQQGTVTPVTNQAGSRPATTTTAPTQVGGIVPDIHNSVLVSTSSQPTLNQISPAHTPTTSTFQLTPQEIAWAQAHFVLYGKKIRVTERMITMKATLYFKNSQCSRTTMKF